MKIPKIEARGASKCTYKNSDDRRTCSRDGFLFRTFKLHNTFHYYRVQDDSDAYVQNKHYKSITRPSPGNIAEGIKDVEGEQNQCRNNIEDPEPSVQVFACVFFI